MRTGVYGRLVPGAHFKKIFFKNFFINACLRTLPTRPLTLRSTRSKADTHRDRPHVSITYECDAERSLAIGLAERSLLTCRRCV